MRSRISLALLVCLLVTLVAAPVGAKQIEPVGDLIPNPPAIQVVPVGDYLDLVHWAPGPVTVTVNGTPLDPAPDGGGGDERVSLTDYGIDLVAGDVVVASQNGWIAEVTTVHVEITAADPATGIVSGLAPDGATVNVEAWTNNGSAERVTTAVNGAFSVNFSVEGGPGDPQPDIITLTPGNLLAAFVYDYPHTGDASKHDWQVPNVPESKADCKKGGWKVLADDEGTLFKNQGDCVSYVAANG